ncbi:probable E3 ubiquitin-protein ligase makorin-1 [Drosophila obscura]|uniref:probable E3 ubiquitin-protein ligase makorin-1 n=1 Tax=Drosophila obscura TaxID=7282 RepID=UPI001BB2325A|nr:probable E3 ubiquitin-protein ligase makorin-1 [Drosophila obscura]
MSEVCSIDPAVGTSPNICRYYVQGICQFGALCRFSHDLSQGSPENENQICIAPDNAVMGSTKPSTSPKCRNWAEAPIFVPSLQDLTENRNKASGNIADENGNHVALLNEVGPYHSSWDYSDYFPYHMHMELCKMCDQYCLHPTDRAQRKEHNLECLKQHEKAMELAFAISRSKDKACGICFEKIMEKSGRENRFGILPNCNHIFCLECIRKWRQEQDFDHKVTRGCPVCRIASDFVCPSGFWVDSQQDKDQLFNDYRAALGAKDCKYFKKGEGSCPFGNKCFYRHSLSNGDIVDVGLPKRTRKLHGHNEITI